MPILYMGKRKLSRSLETCDEKDISYDREVKDEVVAEILELSKNKKSKFVDFEDLDKYLQ